MGHAARGDRFTRLHAGRGAGRLLQLSDDRVLTGHVGEHPFAAGRTRTGGLSRLPVNCFGGHQRR
jgi:hypothetical protein